MSKNKITKAERLQGQLIEVENLLQEAYLALLVVKAGIWREPAFNACGLRGAGVAVHSVEAAVDAIERFQNCKEPNAN